MANAIVTSPGEPIKEVDSPLKFGANCISEKEQAAKTLVENGTIKPIPLETAKPKRTVTLDNGCTIDYL